MSESEETAPARHSPWRKRVVIGLGILAILCCGCIAIFLLIPTPETAEFPSDTPPITESPSPTATSILLTSTAIPVATATATPQPPASPTLTAIPPASTAVPTSTAPPPTETTVPTVTADPDEEVYRSEIVKLSASYATALDQLGTLLTNAGQDVTLLVDDDWRLNVIFALVTIQTNNEQVRKLIPTAKYAAAHEHFLEAASHYDNMAELMIQGLDEFDAEKIVQAVEELDMGNQAINAATLALPEN